VKAVRMIAEIRDEHLKREWRHFVAQHLDKMSETVSLSAKQSHDLAATISKLLGSINQL